MVSIVLLCLGLVAGADRLKPISWNVWAGNIEREGGGGNPYKGLEERAGFSDIRVCEPQCWIKSTACSHSYRQNGLNLPTGSERAARCPKAENVIRSLKLKTAWPHQLKRLVLNITKERVLALMVECVAQERAKAVQGGKLRGHQLSMHLSHGILCRCRNCRASLILLYGELKLLSGSRSTLSSRKRVPRVSWWTCTHDLTRLVARENSSLPVG